MGHIGGKIQKSKGMLFFLYLQSSIFTMLCLVTHWYLINQSSFLANIIHLLSSCVLYSAVLYHFSLEQLLRTLTSPARLWMTLSILQQDSAMTLAILESGNNCDWIVFLMLIALGKDGLVFKYDETIRSSISLKSLSRLHFCSSK